MTAARADLDIAARRPLRLGIATAAGVHWVTPADPIRVRGADLREVARRVAATRRDHPGAEVVVDIDFVIADDERGARAIASATCSAPDPQTMIYVGTPAGLAGLIADIYAIDLADGAVLISRAAGGADQIQERVVPILATMTRVRASATEEQTA